MTNRTKFLADARKECISQGCTEEETETCVDYLSENIDYYVNQFGTAKKTVWFYLNGNG